MRLRLRLDVDASKVGVRFGGARGGDGARWRLRLMRVAGWLDAVAEVGWAVRRRLDLEVIEAVARDGEV